jgi:hypothetical protein
MEEVASTPKLVDPAAFGEGGLSATLPRSEIETALRDDAGADLFLEIARIQNGERDDRTVKVAWERNDLEDLLERAAGDPVTLTFSAEEVERMLDADFEAHGLREKALVLTVAAATAAAGLAGTASAQVMGEGGSVAAGGNAVSGLVTDASTSGVPGSIPGIVTDASSAGSAAETSAPADGWMSGVESPVPGPAGVNVVTDTTTSGQPGAVTSFATDASTAGEPGAVSGLITDTGAEATRLPSEPATGGGGFSMPDPAVDAALAAGLAMLITGAAFVGRTRRRDAQPA